jgi:hypothetical protein
VWFVSGAGNRLAVSEYPGRTVERSRGRQSTGGRSGVVSANRRLSTISVGDRIQLVRPSRIAVSVVVAVPSIVSAVLSAGVVAPPAGIAAPSAGGTVLLIVVAVLVAGVDQSLTGCGEASGGVSIS